jgi:hypothetical protein
MSLGSSSGQWLEWPQRIESALLHLPFVRGAEWPSVDQMNTVFEQLLRRLKCWRSTRASSVREVCMCDKQHTLVHIKVLGYSSIIAISRLDRPSPPITSRVHQITPRNANESL